MKKQLLLICVFVTLIGCKDSEEITPERLLAGSWSRVKDSGGFSFLDSFEIKEDGSVFGTSIVRELGSEDTIGYLREVYGSYFVEEISTSKLKLIMEFDTYLITSSTDFPFGTKDQLVPAEVSGVSEFIIEDDFSTLAFICLSTDDCLENPPYKKVE
ncbi:hypothetical protein SAMN04489724_4077 [Algoriphagus locisalis]|uniref:Lipocalin-like domain-containing protein n=1 Tax=Algoriphagus locisalis TaxID=305507 RepID=A0A1I7DKA5_9BACT|nr:hypothetical protein [Algoriphagus locisalis]SFU12142.1 hypothetical protein SAMN04489724_4077 [Algoriphagus locisalis]